MGIVDCDRRGGSWVNSWVRWAEDFAACLLNVFVYSTAFVARWMVPSA